MIIPQLIRKLLPLWIVIFVLSCLGTFSAFVLPSPWTWLSAVFVFLAGVSYCAFMFGASLVCIIENTLLRWFGQPATGTVLDFHGIKQGIIVMATNTMVCASSWRSTFQTAGHL